MKYLTQLTLLVNIFMQASLFLSLFNNVVEIRSIISPVSVHSLHKHAVLDLQIEPPLSLPFQLNLLLSQFFLSLFHLLSHLSLKK